MNKFHAKIANDKIEIGLPRNLKRPELKDQNFVPELKEFQYNDNYS